MAEDEETLATPPRRRRPALGPSLGARYQHLELLGEGAFGEVHRVLDKRLGRVVAMKILRPEHARSELDVARFVDEAQAASQLQHPAIVPIYDLDRLADGRPYFTMREVSGRSLHQALNLAHKSLDPADPMPTIRPLVDAVRRAAEAVGYAHRRGVIHRDLKPSNVLLDSDGALWVVDWGLAKVVGSDVDRAPQPVALTGRGSSVRTLTGTLIGTPAYMPPEQAEGRVHDLDARTDVYALGAILYTVLSGAPPYAGRTGFGGAIAVLTGPPRPIVELAPSVAPSALLACCEQAMSRSPEARYPSAVELAAELAAWLEGRR